MDLRETQYEYELISGNVKEVHYQAGARDAMHQFYEYDADNRLSDVYTLAVPRADGPGAPYAPLSGGDRDLMSHDAKYIYYTHGPLARMELGNKQVQGMDYAYTIQGWVKGMNANVLDVGLDMGKDANDGNGYISSSANIHQKFGADAYGYNLGYYANTPSDGGTDFYDYQAINTTYGDDFHDDVLALNDVDLNLFNGNIKSMAVALSEKNSTNPPTIMSLMDNQYSYDQLNRLVANTTYTTSSTSSYGSAASGNKYKTTYTYDANGNLTALSRYDHTATLMDNLTYNYNYTVHNSNILANVDDAIGAGVSTTDIDDQSATNYLYDEIGNLARDLSEEIEDIEWTVYGKIKSITRTTNTHNFPDMAFEYDAAGNRIMKVVKPRTAGVLSSSDEWTYTYYSRDPQGNVLAVYELTTEYDGFCGYHNVFDLKEHHIYGSSRLGVDNKDDELHNSCLNSSDGNGVYFTRTLGNKYYEMSNHLGNVAVVVSDRKVPVEDGSSGSLDYYAADVVTSSDYYPFGSLLPDRSSSSNSYRYGMNSQEKDDEIAGVTGSHYAAKYWEYDARLGRRWNIDPIVKPWESGYASFGNNPILNSDPYGLDVINAHEKDRKSAKNNLDKAQNKFNSLEKGDEGYRSAKRELKKAQKSYDYINDKYQRVEKKISEIKEKDLDLYNNADNLKDPGGNKIDIYVYDTPHDIMQEGISPEQVKYGDTDASPGAQVESFNGNKPSYVKVYSNKHGDNTITIRMSESSKTRDLAHEFGHAIYQGKYMKQYLDWLKANPKEQNKGGHGKNDPSGKAAVDAEKNFK